MAGIDQLPRQSSSRLALLCLASVWPYPPTGGSRILVYEQLRALADHHDVDLVAADWPEDAFLKLADTDINSALSFCRRLELVPLPVKEKRFSHIEKVKLSVSSRVPFFMFQRYSSEAQVRIDRMLAAGEYDAIVAHDNEAGLYVKATHAPMKILTKHSVLSVQHMQRAGQESSLWKAAKYQAYASALRRWERDESKTFDLVKVPTRIDLAQWRAIVGEGTPAFINSNGVDTHYFRYEPRSGDVDRLVFTATMSSEANAGAAADFLDQVYPLLRAKGYSLPFYIVGASPPAWLTEKAEKIGATATGTVPDVRPYFSGKPIAVVPLRVASGIINKVLEPMALGVPVVATTPSVEGLEVDPESVCLVADTPQEFAEAVTRLVDDPKLYDEITRSAARYVRDEHSWGLQMRRFREEIEHRVVAWQAAATA